VQQRCADVLTIMLEMHCSWNIM